MRTLKRARARRMEARAERHRAYFLMRPQLQAYAGLQREEVYQRTEEHLQVVVAAHAEHLRAATERDERFEAEAQRVALEEAQERLQIVRLINEGMTIGESVAHVLRATPPRADGAAVEALARNAEAAAPPTGKDKFVYGTQSGPERALLGDLTAAEIAVEVDPARLANGTQPGDIYRSSSAELIPQGRVRWPFHFGNELYVNTGGGAGWCHALRLVPRADFAGETATYAERLRENGSAPARRDFYEGLLVTWRNQDFVLACPRLRIKPRPPVRVPERPLLALPCADFELHLAALALISDRAQLQDYLARYQLPADAAAFKADDDRFSAEQRAQLVAAVASALAAFAEPPPGGGDGAGSAGTHQRAGHKTSAAAPPPWRGAEAAAPAAAPDDGRPNLLNFFLARGRLPHITDAVKPWHYRGFLLPYVIELHRHPLFGKPDVPAALRDALPAELLARGTGQCPDRWGYYFRTLEAGRLLDEPIPRIEFHAEWEPQVRAHWEVERRRRCGIQEWVRIIEQNDHWGWDNFRQLIDWLAWALGCEAEAPGLNEQANEALYRTVNLEPLLLRPCDYFGSFLAGTKAKGWNPTAFFPTPHIAVELMTQMTFGAGDNGCDQRRLAVGEPCVGTGRMLLHASNYSLNLSGCDIDPLVVRICKINGALYAPWLTWPLPDAVLYAGTERKKLAA